MHLTVARLIENFGSEGQAVRLFSCSTGACPTGFAQRLANELNVPVLAPNDILWIGADGGWHIGPTSDENKAKGFFQLFLPGGDIHD